MNDRVTPRCCEAVEKHKSVFLVMPASWSGGDASTPPVWKVAGLSPEFHCEDWFPALFCPFCGSTLPEIVRVDPERPVCACTDGGYYCDTCKERLSECECLPAYKAWGPKT